MKRSTSASNLSHSAMPIITGCHGRLARPCGSSNAIHAAMIALAALCLLTTVPLLTAQTAQSTAAPAPHKQPAQPWPGITVNRKAGYIDLDATVANRKADWIELLACSPHSHEYEAICTVAARPSQIHLALLTLGLKPGKPLTFEKTKEGKFIVHPPRGPLVAVDFVVTDHGKTREIPANQWVINQKTGKVMPDNHFLFTGSQFVQYQGKQVYVADLNGTVLSIVDFGDEVLSRDTTTTNQSDGQQWAINTKLVPPVGTQIKIRLRPVKNAKP